MLNEMDERANAGRAHRQILVQSPPREGHEVVLERRGVIPHDRREARYSPALTPAALRLSSCQAEKISFACAAVMPSTASAPR